MLLPRNGPRLCGHLVPVLACAAVAIGAGIAAHWGAGEPASVAYTGTTGAGIGIVPSFGPVPAHGFSHASLPPLRSIAHNDGFGEIGIMPDTIQKERYVEQYVEVSGRVEGQHRGDVEITLTGPSGETSVRVVPASSEGEFSTVIAVGFETPSGIHRIVAREPARNATSPTLALFVHDLSGVLNRVDVGSHSRSCVAAGSCNMPQDIHVAPGDTVRWLNADEAAHTVASHDKRTLPSGAAERLFYSSLMAPGDLFAHRFAEPGTYGYACSIHPWATGTVIVEAPEKIDAPIAPESAGATRGADAVRPTAPLRAERAEAAMSVDIIGGARGPYSPGDTVSIMARLSGEPDVIDGKVYYEVSDPSGESVSRGSARVGDSAELHLADHAVTSGHMNGTHTYKALASVSTGRTLVASGEFDVAVPAAYAAEEAVAEPQGGGCMIATAAYGSELAPRVQRLREVRDSVVMETGEGRAFMDWLNVAYYSVSPAIADAQRDIPELRAAMRVAVSPMVHALGILEHAGHGSARDVVALGTLAILANALIYVGVPAAVLSLARRAKAQFSAKAAACSPARTSIAEAARTRASARPTCARTAESATMQEASRARCASAAHAPRRK